MGIAVQAVKPVSVLMAEFGTIVVSVDVGMTEESISFPVGQAKAIAAEILRVSKEAASGG